MRRARSRQCNGCQPDSDYLRLLSFARVALGSVPRACAADLHRPSALCGPLTRVLFPFYAHGVKLGESNTAVERQSNIVAERQSFTIAADPTQEKLCR